MAFINVCEVSKQFGVHVVLEKASLTVHAGESVGLVGPNGAGKTTLFRLIAGELSPDSGTVTIARGSRIGYLRQEQPPADVRTVYDEAAEAFAGLHRLEHRLHQLGDQIATTHDPGELKERMAAYERVNSGFIAAGGHSYPARIGEVLGGLGFSLSDYHRPLNSLSGGERCRVALARLLLEDQPVLLLDEPTNHLDIDAVRWLEKFLAGHRGCIVLVSHDRYLLDRVCGRIVELSNRTLTGYSGNYSTYAQTKAIRELTQQRQFAQDQEFIAKERAYIAKHLAGQRSNQAKGRRTRLERRLEAGEFVTEAPSQRRAARIEFAGRRQSEQVVLRCDELCVGIGERALVRGLTAQVAAGDRLGITGPNGTGKTTLLRTLLGEIPPLAGAFELSVRLRVGYHAQAELDLDGAKRLVDEIRGVRPDFTEQQARSYLALFLFRGDDVFKPLGVLSGGEQSRVRLAKLILSEPDLLILDEPTNHLDIPSRDALEQALNEFPGTIVAVSHDRYFLDRVAKRMLVIRPEGHRLLPGNYSNYIAQLEAESARPSQSAPAQKKPDPSLAVAGPVAAARPQGPDTSKYNHLSIEKLEEMVVEREIKLAELQQRFGDPALYKEPDALEELQEDIEALSDELAVIDAAWHERVAEQ